MHSQIYAGTQTVSDSERDHTFGFVADNLVGGDGVAFEKADSLVEVFENLVVNLGYCGTGCAVFCDFLDILVGKEADARSVGIAVVVILVDLDKSPVVESADGKSLCTVEL